MSQRTGSHPTRFEMIAHQMMKGINSPCAANGRAGTDQQINDFKNLYSETIKYIQEKMPKSVSVGVSGAIGKAVLWYGKEKMEPFIEAFSTRDYKGINDPVHILWEWLLKNNNRKHYAKEIYQRTVTAIRSYLRNAPISKGKLVPALEDIFEWSDDYTTMLQPKPNQHTTSRENWNKKKTQIAAEIEEILEKGFNYD